MRGLTLCLAVAAGLFAAEKEEDKGVKELQGKWVAMALRHGDAETPKEEIEKGAVTLNVVGSHFTFKTPKETHVGVMKADPTARTIDLLIETKDGKGKKVLCIYEQDGDTLRIAGDQEKRPKDFKSKLGGSIVVVLKRVS
jgi:uncharacterized protein (TIGR03067 family)